MTAFRSAHTHGAQTVCTHAWRTDPPAPVLIYLTGAQELIKQGVLRPCPKCATPQSKDFGMCNIMQCAKCGIWWNWRTRETGASSNDLKARARATGTMWEAGACGGLCSRALTHSSSPACTGELQYQQQLQRSDLAKFKELLRRCSGANANARTEASARER